MKGKNIPNIIPKEYVQYLSKYGYITHKLLSFLSYFDASLMKRFGNVKKRRTMSDDRLLSVKLLIKILSKIPKHCAKYIIHTFHFELILHPTFKDNPNAQTAKS